ncbi:MAG: hypothetical protein JSR24_10565 [Proteobacteria bacterium]|nr:hypothetical protein [Pseudomonadota bacterium]
MTSASDRDSRLWRKLLFDDAPWLPLTLLAAAIVAVSAWLLAAAPRIVSRQMTWDMLFNIAGAWSIHNGHVPHVDFHDPLGSLSFRFTAIGFWFTGPSVWAFIAGEIVATAGLFVVALIAAGRRLPVVPAAVFIAYVCLLVLMPINVGEPVGDFTFAMDYNAMGWSGLGVLSFILFVPPRARSEEGRLRDGPDFAVVAVLLLALYHLKITYFGAALGELCIAALVSEHLRRRQALWTALAVAALLYSVAPWNWAYLSDVFAALDTGAASTDVRGFLKLVLSNVPELSLMCIGAIVALALWRAGEVSLRVPVAVGLFIAAAIAVLSQNTQLRGLPLSVAIAFLLYDHLRGNRLQGRPRAAVWVMVALMVFPVAGVAKQLASLSVYYWQSVRSPMLHVVQHPPTLKGLAVPRDEPGLLDAVARGGIDRGLLSRIRTLDIDNEELSQNEYTETLAEAVALFEGNPERATGGIVVFDQVNPMPFILKRPPPRGVTLWLDKFFPWQPASSMLGDARYVLIPKFSTYRAVTLMATERYGAYLAEHFPQRTETRSWVLRERAPR